MAAGDLLSLSARDATARGRLRHSWRKTCLPEREIWVYAVHANGCRAKMARKTGCSIKNEQPDENHETRRGAVKEPPLAPQTIMPAATVSLVAGSMRMNEPVWRLRR